MSDPQEVERRVALLKALLEEDYPDTDMIIRELSRLVISVYGELSTLSLIRNELARLIGRLNLFMDDQLQVRIERSLQEAAAAQAQLEKSKQVAMDSQEMRAVLKQDIETMTRILVPGRKTLPRRMLQALRRKKDA